MFLGFLLPMSVAKLERVISTVIYFLSKGYSSLSGGTSLIAACWLTEGNVLSRRTDPNMNVMV